MSLLSEVMKLKCCGRLSETRGKTDTAEMGGEILSLQKTLGSNYRGKIRIIKMVVKSRHYVETMSEIKECVGYRLIILAINT